MIAHLRGKLAWAGTDQVIIDVGGVGYRAYVPASTRTRLPASGREVQLFTHLAVREDALTLYGFLGQDEFQLFEQLITVDGVGPKLALAVLSAVNPESFRRAVIFDDVKSLVTIPGVGKKTAQRMVLELRDKLGALGVTEAELPGAAAAALPGEPLAEALEALVSLGFTRLEAGKALESARAEAGEAASTEKLVRIGLKGLSKGR